MSAAAPTSPTAPAVPGPLRTRALRCGAVSVRVAPRTAAGLTLLVLVTVAVVVVALGVGDYWIAPPDVALAVLGLGDDPAATFVVQGLRLPRVLAGACVGLALGLAGAATSSALRNPLATPDVVGVTTGASAGAVLVLLAPTVAPGLLAAVPPGGVPAAALTGGLGVAALVGALSWRDGFAGPRWVLTGVALSSAATALTTFLLVRVDLTDAQQAMLWLTGSLNARTVADTTPLLVALVLLGPVLLAHSHALRLLGLGDDAAQGLGVAVRRTRATVLALACTLAALATAAAGPVGFVALVSPPVARRLTRDPGAALGASALTGAVLTLTADLLGRRATTWLGLGFGEIPVGAVTALVGAPVLMVLLRRTLTGRPAAARTGG